MSKMCREIDDMPDKVIKRIKKDNNESALVDKWHGKPYYSLNAYFKNVYGEKVYKIAVDAGLTCPNRDGKLDKRGCIFCSAGGSGDFAVDIERTVYNKEYGHVKKQAIDIKRQIERGLAKFNKTVGERFVIYFQAYTNTYGDTNYLRKIWEAALLYDAVCGISIATRPDCLSDEILLLLATLKEKYKDKFIWIELGLQTIHEESANYIRRHYKLSCYDEAVSKLKELDIPFITHIILGLPNETDEDMLETIKYVSENIRKPFGIKLQLLHVLKNTDLLLDYEKGVFDVLTEDAYIDLLIELIRNIPEDIVLHRVTGDGPKNILVAPLWSGNKKVVLNHLHKRFCELKARQGDLI